MSRRIQAYERPLGDDDDLDFEEEEAPRRRRREADLRILLDEPRFLVVAKPAGVPSVPDRFRTDEPTVVDLAHAALAAKAPGAPRPLVVHRLDRDTSGALVLAKDDEAAKDLMAQFEAREVSKSYVAITVGAPQPPSGSVTFRVDDHPKRPGAMQLVAKGGRECESSWETLEAWRAVSLVRVRPRTGRTHQVRLTLLHLGTPCAIDPLYGSSEPLLLSAWKAGYRLGKGRREVPLIDRLTLHAESIEFRRPGAPAGDANARVRVECPMPRDLETAVRQIRRWGAPGTL